MKNMPSARRVCLTRPLANQRLYRERVPQRHDAVVDVVLVVQHVWVGVERFPDAVAACGKRVTPQPTKNRAGGGEGKDSTSRLLDAISKVEGRGGWDRTLLAPKNAASCVDYTQVVGFDTAVLTLNGSRDRNGAANACRLTPVRQHTYIRVGTATSAFIVAQNFGLKKTIPTSTSPR